MNKERAIEIIRKCIALSENNTSIQEANTAILKAQELQAKHEITQEDLGSDPEKIVHTAISSWGRNPLWKKVLAAVVAENFRCFWYTKNNDGKTQIVLIGLQGDVELAKGMYEYALKVVEDAYAQYKTTNKGLHKGSSMGIRNDFFFGFVDGLRDQLRGQVSENEWSIILGLDARVLSEIEKIRLGYAISSGVSSEGKKEVYGYGRNIGKMI